jgi:predicted transposase/invertase (TIGR01784 family)
LVVRKVEKCRELAYNNTMSEIDVGEIMETLGQRLREEGRREAEYKSWKKVLFEVAKRMLEDELPIESIAKYTGLTEKEIKALMS